MNKTKYKKVLFIAYLFPPVGGSGVQRTAKFVKYLPAFGWQPLVITVKEPYDFYKDETLLKDIGKDVKVFRTFSIEPMKWVRKLLKRKTKEKLKTGNKSINPSKKSLKPTFLIKLKTYLLVPDNEILWFPFAVWKGWKIVRKEKPEIIYSTSAPYTDHLIALFIAKLSGLPWIADFRDPWVDRANFPSSRWRLFIDRKLEKMVINKANHIVTTTPLITERFNELYPGNNYTTITNGFDDDDFTDQHYLKPSGQEFRITYTGVFNSERKPGMVFKAIRELIDSRDDFKSKINIRIIGQLDNPGDFENFIFFKKLKLNEYSELLEYQPHQQVISEMSQATILLLMVGIYDNNETLIPGKIFEYLRAGRPILAVVPPQGSAADVIRETNSGLVVSNENYDEIKEGISKMFDLFLEGKLDETFKTEDIEKYSRENLTKKLSEVFESLLK